MIKYCSIQVPADQHGRWMRARLSQTSELAACSEFGRGSLVLLPACTSRDAVGLLLRKSFSDVAESWKAGTLWDYLGE